MIILQISQASMDTKYKNIGVLMKIVDFQGVHYEAWTGDDTKSPLFGTYAEHDKNDVNRIVIYEDDCKDLEVGFLYLKDGLMRGELKGGIINGQEGITNNGYPRILIRLKKRS